VIGESTDEPAFICAHFLKCYTPTKIKDQYFRALINARSINALPVISLFHITSEAYAETHKQNFRIRNYFNVPEDFYILFEGAHVYRKQSQTSHHVV
jgi:hypothetical protein